MSWLIERKDECYLTTGEKISDRGSFHFAEHGYDPPAILNKRLNRLMKPLVLLCETIHWHVKGEIIFEPNN